MTRLDLFAAALVPFNAASPREQMRRVRAELFAVSAMYRRREGSVWALLELLARVPNRPPALIAATRRRLIAVARTTDLRGWEARVGHDQVELALSAAFAFCDPTKRSWLEVAR